MKLTLARIAVLLTFAAVPAVIAAQSFYPERLEDKSAVYLTQERFGSKGDGIADDTAALQKGIDAVADTTRQGILFLPEGRYRITHTLYVWPGVRILGYGAQRPVIFLAPNTPGYGEAPAYMVMFTGGRTGEERHGHSSKSNSPFPGTVPPESDVVDANPGTFYTAMSNIDFEIGDGNPGAIGIRLHFAQHCFLTHMTFRIGSGTAALHDVGNEMEDLHFIGGRYAIMTGRPSPGWQFTLLDSTFEGQREASIHEHEAGLVLVHDTFRNVPTAVDIEPNAIDELWIKNSRFENISGPAVMISAEHSRLTEINMENVVCDHVPVFAKLRESGKTFAGKGERYHVTTFTHGLIFDSPTSKGIFDSRMNAEPLASMPAADKPAIPALPTHTGWVNAQLHGVKGDGTTDDTSALQHLVDTERIIYLPSGRYRLTDTLRLRPDTVLIGLHPSTTQFDLADSTPGFDGAGAPTPMLLAPAGGHNIVMGVGLFTGGINNRAVAAMWMAGADSLMDDVRFLGGHGTNNPDGSRINPYNSTHGGDPNPLYRWDAQYPSLWILNGGGGTFADIWTPDTFAQAGLYISNTRTEGHVYELSSEHHVRNEVVLNHVANWEIVALQTEEERGEGGFCLPLSIQDSENITIAEMHAYRVVSSFQPFLETIHTSGSHNIRFRNLHIYSDSKAVFDASLVDDDSHSSNRELEMAALNIPERPKLSATLSGDNIVQAKRLVGGFFNASSPALDPDGNLYFVDTVKQHIFRYLRGEKRLEIVRDSPIEPANIFFDKSGDLLVLSYIGNGTVYSLRPDAPASESQVLKAEPVNSRPGGTPLLPVDRWSFNADLSMDLKVPKPWGFKSPDGSVFLPAGDDFVDGVLYYGTKMADVLRAFSLAPAQAGKPFYVTDEGKKKTYSVQVAPDGSVSSIKLFADQGGEGIAVAPNGNVYMAAGEVYVYRPDGTLASEIDVPERPTCLIFSKDGRTLYILARTALYSAMPGAGMKSSRRP
jgi:sugar lactone lactonase YvrE